MCVYVCVCVCVCVYVCVCVCVLVCCMISNQLCCVQTHSQPDWCGEDGVKK